MVVAMFILMYKKANDIGYKTVKRHFKQEIRDLAIALIIVQSGGNPSKLFSPKLYSIKMVEISSDHD